MGKLYLHLLTFSLIFFVFVFLSELRGFIHAFFRFIV